MPDTETIFKQNLTFNRRMRGFHYEKAWSLFQRLETELRGAAGDGLNSVVDLLDQYIQVLELTNEYARSTVRGYKRQKLASFREDHQEGIMEEEMVFVCFLEELLSSSVYLRNRFETNSYLGRYIQFIQERDDYLEKKKGFLTNIISYLEADRKADREEILQIARLIRKRFRNASNIYTILKRRDEIIVKEASG